jgi:hypothetical protein
MALSQLFAMTEPAVYPLHIYRGDSYRWIFICWADSAKTVPADLTGVVVIAEIHQVRIIVPLTCIVTGQEIEMKLSGVDSKSLDRSDAVWDLQLAYPSGDVKTILKGGVLIKGDVVGSRAA